MSYTKYYQYELDKLKKLGIEFSKRYPSLAPMLGSASSDPDVERLLEGVAFLTSLLHQKLDDDFPEFIHSLADMLFPHYLRPIPSCTMMAFYPKNSLKERFLIKKGTSIASKMIDEQKCFFRTTFDVATYPLNIRKSYYHKETSKKGKIIVDFAFEGFTVGAFNDDIVLYLGDTYTEASELFRVMMHDVEKVKIKNDENSKVFNGNIIKASGFEPDNKLFTYPRRSFEGYRYFQEYFIFPSKFLFVRIEGIKEFIKSSESETFTLEFILKDGKEYQYDINENSLRLFCSPAINLFEMETEPILRDHRVEKYRIRATTNNNTGVDIYSINDVTGMEYGTLTKRTFSSFENFNASYDEEQESVYKILREKSPVTGKTELFISFIQDFNGAKPMDVKETISIKTTCTNGEAASGLRMGDVMFSTDNSPERLDFKNISNITASVEAPLEKRMIWRILSHLFINIETICSKNNLKEILKLYVFATDRDKARVSSNMMRINAIEEVTLLPEDRLLKGVLIRGQKIAIKIKSDHFASRGDMYIFGVILDEFFSAYSSINSYTMLEMTDTVTGEVLRWPPRLGQKKLL